jgi:hypothetical protein
VKEEKASSTPKKTVKEPIQCISVSAQKNFLVK